MTIKHTPGPWIARREYSGESGRWYIRGINNEWIGAVSLANAHLIAAAPDFLKAAVKTLAHLEELAEAWRSGALTEHDGKGGTRSNRNMDIIAQFRAAIAKAEGKEAE